MKDKFPECEFCVNKDFDPFQCETCEDACNFEPFEEDSMDEEPEDMSIQEFVEFWRNGQ